MNRKILFINHSDITDSYDFSDVPGMLEIVREIFINHNCPKCSDGIKFFNSRYELKCSKDLISYIKKQLISKYTNKYEHVDYAEIIEILDTLNENYTLHYDYVQSFYKIL